MSGNRRKSATVGGRDGVAFRGTVFEESGEEPERQTHIVFFQKMHDKSGNARERGGQFLDVG